MIQKLDVDFSHSDERGSICQILSVPNAQVNYLFTKAGAKRGNHYHKINREYFYVVSGRVRITGRNVLDSGRTESHEFEQGELFVIEPYCSHELEFKEDTQMIAVYDRGVYCTNNGGGYKTYILCSKRRFCRALSPQQKKCNGGKTR